VTQVRAAALPVGNKVGETVKIYGRSCVRRRARLVVALAVACVAPLRASADPVEDFYRGKTINVLIGVGAGGEYDTIARLVARYIGRYIPGHPALVPQNMTGASGLKLMNYLATLAPHDGTSIGMISEGLPSLQAVGMPGVQFDAVKFNWLGAIAPIDETIAVWHTTGVTTLQGARERQIITGATAHGSITYTFPALLNELLGTKLKLVTGYDGGTAINLAMERGEVEARDNTWSSWKVTRPQWLRDHKISIIVQSGPGAADLDAPLVADLIKDPDVRRLADLVLSGCALGRPLTITPGVPAERVAALRAAFDETVTDPAFLAEAKSLNFDVDPIHGVDMQKTIEHILAVPSEVATRAKHLLE
jgi:tripartite-type tricarboxylate transporter receptor subunit TctC